MNIMFPDSLKEAIPTYLEACETMQSSLEKMGVFTRGEYNEHDGYYPTAEGWEKFDSGRRTAVGHLETVILGLKHMVEAMK